MRVLRLHMRMRASGTLAFRCALEYGLSTCDRRQIVLVESTDLQVFRQKIEAVQRELEELVREAELRWARHEAELYEVTPKSTPVKEPSSG